MNRQSTGLVRGSGGWTVHTDHGEPMTADHVVVALGIGAVSLAIVVTWPKSYAMPAGPLTLLQKLKRAVAHLPPPVRRRKVVALLLGLSLLLSALCVLYVARRLRRSAPASPATAGPRPAAVPR